MNKFEQMEQDRINRARRIEGLIIWGVVYPALLAVAVFFMPAYGGFWHL
jgi:hypothetical protein